MPARLLAAVLAALVLLATACGGSDGSSPDTTGVTTEGDRMADAPPDDLAEVAADTYVAGYPLVVSTRTFARLGGMLGVNQLLWQSQLSGPDSRIIVAPNRDTLYSVAVLDLRSEPMVLSLPEVTDRYFTYQFLDAWTESFAYIGTRATDGRAGTWVITPPGWEGEIPAGTERIEAPTPQVFLLGRYLVDDDADIDAVRAISAVATLEPLSSLTGDPPPPPPPPLDPPEGSAQEIPVDASFFDELGAALAVNPPTTEAQRALFDRALALGVGPDLRPTETEDGDTLDALAGGASAADARIDAGTEDASERVNGWTVNREVGAYGDDLDLRAAVARIGWGANVPEEAVYPIAREDADGDPLDGSSTYRIRFPAGGLPPVEAFWSLSAYGEDMFFAPHPSGRWTIGDRTPGLVVGDDGTLELTLSHEEPAAGAANWLPVPDGPFVLMLRLYLPGEPVLDGSYEYPPVEEIEP